ncbi:MAG: hypothetical protein ABIL68_08240 [bacterium]
MKKGLLFTVALLILASGAQAQIEKGDTEVSFMGYYITYVGGEDVVGFGSGSFQLSFGKYLTNRVIIGVAPTVSFTKMQDEWETNWSGSAYMNINFSSSAKMIPYITGQYYQYTFKIPAFADFTDFSYINVGLGFKSFFNEYAALNTLVSYGFSLAEDAEGGILMIMTGLSFIF